MSHHQVSSASKDALVPSSWFLATAPKGHQSHKSLVSYLPALPGDLKYSRVSQRYQTLIWEVVLKQRALLYLLPNSHCCPIVLLEKRFRGTNW